MTWSDLEPVARLANALTVLFLIYFVARLDWRVHKLETQLQEEQPPPEPPTSPP